MCSLRNNIVQNIYLFSVNGIVLNIINFYSRSNKSLPEGEWSRSVGCNESSITQKTFRWIQSHRKSAAVACANFQILVTLNMISHGLQYSFFVLLLLININLVHKMHCINIKKYYNRLITIASTFYQKVWFTKICVKLCFFLFFYKQSM